MFSEIVVSWFGRLVGGNVGFNNAYKRFEVMTLSGRLPMTLWNEYGVFCLRVCSIIDIGGLRRVVRSLSGSMMLSNKSTFVK